MYRLCGSSSAGRASRCQRECREFESRFPLQIQKPVSLIQAFLLPLTLSGRIAKRLCRGLQSLTDQFDSGSGLHIQKKPDFLIGLFFMRLLYNHPETFA